MSLDVFLKLPGATIPAGSGIFIREAGATREITRAEWDARHPGEEPVTCSHARDGVVFTANITHNLGAMAGAAGVYEALWRPEEIGVSKAGQLVPLLRDGLTKLLGHPEVYRELNPDNGWGDYDGLIRFVAAYLAACEGSPEADVEVSR